MESQDIKVVKVQNLKKVIIDYDPRKGGNQIKPNGNNGNGSKNPAPKPEPTLEEIKKARKQALKTFSFFGIVLYALTHI